MLAGNKFVGASAWSSTAGGHSSSTPVGASDMNSSLVASTGVSHVSSSGGGRPSASASAASIWDTIWQTDDFDENAVAYEKEETPSRDAIVFLVDCSPFMFEPTSGGETPFVMALECIMMAVTQKLISAPTDELAVVFYGTRDQQGDFPGVFVFADFDKPSANLIERLDELKVPGNYKLGHWINQNPDSEFNLCDAFWTASSLLGRIKNASERRVWLFTDEDTPHHDEDLLTRAKARLEDYRGSGVTMRLFAIQRANSHTFSLGPFYRLCPDPDIEEGTGNWTAENRLEQLALLTTQRVMKKRAQCSLKMQVAPGLEMGVKLYTLLREADKMKYVYLDPVQAFPCVCRTRWVCSDTGQHLRPQQIKKVFPLGDRKVVFETEELASIKFCFTPGITVLGFKSRSSLSDIHNLTHSSFLFADDKAIIGSGLLFKLLIDKCIERDQFVLARLAARTNSIARLVALWPAKEEYEGDVMVHPSGFHVIVLPYADEIRELEVDQDFEAATPTPEQCLIATKLTECLVSDFDPDMFPNPSLQKHFAVLKTYALQKAEIEKSFQDNLLPDEEGMSHFKNIFDEYKEALQYEDRGGGDGESKPKKRAAAASKDVEEFEGDWAELLSSDANMKKVTVPQLKSKLKQEGQKVGGNKPELWERLKEALAGSGGSSAAPKKKVKQEIKEEEEW